MNKVLQGVSSWIDSHPSSPDCTLTPISPSANGFSGSKWQIIGQAWAKARRSLRAASGQGLAEWRTVYQLGHPVDQRVFLFQDKSNSSHYFCLVPTDTLKRPTDPSAWIIKAIQAVGLRWYVNQNGLPLHASAVSHRGKGYLFLGPSGAGKSTAAQLSEQVGATVVHDDQVLIGFHKGVYILAYPGNPVMPPLQAVFLLHKSDTDRLMPLSPQETGAGLAHGLLEYATGQDLYSSWVRQAFHNAAAIARRVPGYILHFRKSSDFWDVIDAELGS